MSTDEAGGGLTDVTELKRTAAKSRSPPIDAWPATTILPSGCTVTAKAESLANSKSCVSSPPEPKFASSTPAGV